VIAYKFVKPDGSSVFTGVKWELPTGRPRAVGRVGDRAVPQRHPRLPRGAPAAAGGSS